MTSPVSKKHTKPPSDYVRIFDTTLRDGEQAPGATLTSEEKLEVARALSRLGVDVIEAGFPSASADDFQAVHDIAETVGIEAISRGADHVWFAENAAPAVAAIRANLAALKINSGYAIEDRGVGALMTRSAA